MLLFSARYCCLLLKILVVLCLKTHQITFSNAQPREYGTVHFFPLHSLSFSHSFASSSISVRIFCCCSLFFLLRSVLALFGSRFGLLLYLGMVVNVNSLTAGVNSKRKYHHRMYTHTHTNIHISIQMHTFTSLYIYQQRRRDESVYITQRRTMQRDAFKFGLFTCT